MTAGSRLAGRPGPTTSASIRVGRVSRSAVVLLAACGLAVSCASNPSRRDADRGTKVLEALVVDREYEAPGTNGSSMRGSGSWYLGLEARDGERTVHYRFPVTRDQYHRYPEGTRVQIIVADDLLREIRPLPESR